MSPQASVVAQSATPATDHAVERNNSAPVVLRGGQGRAIAALLRADLRQRMRTPRFWALIVVLGALMWWCFPAANADYLTVSVQGGVRGQYSSAWIGMVAALLYSSLLSLAGFYLVRGTFTRDLESRIWQLLVATTMTRGGYLVAKWLSHLVVFTMIMLVGLLVGLVAQLVRGEDMAVDLVELVKPALLLSLPALAVTSALAVWFDLVPWLRRSAGNILYFVLWIAMLISGIPQDAPRVDAPPFPGDVHGLAVARYAISNTWPDDAERKSYGMTLGMRPLNGEPPQIRAWRAWPVSLSTVASRVAWLLAALGLLLLATPLLDRFAAKAAGTRDARTGGATLKWLELLLRPLQGSAFGALLAAEWRLILRPRRLWWWLLVVGALVAQLFAVGKGLPVAIIAGWLLGMDVLARLILRERETSTAALVFSAPRIRRRLLLARLLVAVGLAWALTLPALLRLAAIQPQAAGALLVVGASIGLWALVAGAVVRNARLFELVFLCAAYAGMQGAPLLDVLSASWTIVAWHALMMPVGAVLLMLGWKRLND